MKLTMKFLFGALLVSTLFFSACTKNTEDVISSTPETSTISDDEVTEQNFEQWLHQQSATKQEVKVTHATLEELNEAMVANGLNPFTQEEIDAKASDRMMWSCSYYDWFGDWNSDNEIDIFDVVGAQQFLCDNVGCDQGYDTTAEPFSGPLGYIKRFGYISYLADGSNINLLDTDEDIYDLIDYILGYPVCNP